MEREEFTPQQYRKFNGQSIMLALQNMGGSATADDLAEHIGALIDLPQHIVKPEVSQVLRRGVSNGFFQRQGKKYFLFNEASSYQVDSSRKRRVKNELSLQTDGSSKRIRFSPPNDYDEGGTNLELKEQSIEGLQEIIAKANEDTKKATILANNAAKRAKLASMKIQELVENEDSISDE